MSKRICRIEDNDSDEDINMKVWYAILLRLLKMSKAHTDSVAVETEPSLPNTHHFFLN